MRAADVSTTSTLGRSLESAPRSAGSTARRSTSAPCPAPSNLCLPAVFALTNSTARLITSIVRRYACSAVSPQTTRPCLASTTSLRSGFSRTAVPTCLASVKPGRM